MGEIKYHILNNRTRGFDELAYNLSVSKEEVKQVWNELKLGFKKIPRTMPLLRPIGTNQQGNTLYELREDLPVFLSPIHPLYIPKGTQTDLGSVPKWARMLVDKDDPTFLIAFLVHDVIYDTKIYSREIADQFLYDLAEELGAVYYKVLLIHRAVRIGGWYWWNKKEPNTALVKKIYLLSMKYMEAQEENLLRLVNGGVC